MPADAGPPSLVLKNWICLAVGLPSSIVHATILPGRGTDSGARVVPTLAWKPVVRLIARHGLVGQLGGIAGAVVEVGMTPSSVSMPSDAAGAPRTPPPPAPLSLAITEPLL